MSTMEEEIRQQELSIRQRVESLQKEPKAKLKRILRDAKDMIRYYNKITSELENRRMNFVHFVVQYAAILVTGIGLMVKVGERGPIYTIVLGSLIIQFVFAIFAIGLYVYQSYYRYPFLQFKYGNQWKWFYYGNPYVPKMGIFGMLNHRVREGTRLKYLKGLHYFLDHYLNETIQEETSAALIQLYLLQVHNFYKNRFYLQLYRLLGWFLLLTLGWVVAYGVCYFIK